MEMVKVPTATVLAKFKAFEIKNTKAIKGGDGDEDNGEGIIGSTDIVDA